MAGDILLNDILRIENPSAFKLHLASTNEDGERPLNLFVKNRQEWINWHTYRYKKSDDWTRDNILSLIEYKTNLWLMGGVFRVLERRNDGYRVEFDELYNKFLGRVVVRFHRYQGLIMRAYLLETFLDKFVVSEILPEEYTGEPFPGISKIRVSFSDLEPIIIRQKTDWMNALSNVKGVYAITDTSSGRIYVGCAYGDVGIWSRWCEYRVRTWRKRGADCATSRARDCLRTGELPVHVARNHFLDDARFPHN